MSFIDIIRKIINPLNVDLVKHPNIDFRRRKKLLDHFNINTIIDVGANSGQYAQQNFGLGFKGKILSFEPVQDVFKTLYKNAEKKNNWNVFNFGLGDADGDFEINISENTFSSSIFDINASHLIGAPKSKYITKEMIKIRTLDNIFDEVIRENENVLLKIDVQGFEKNVLEGAITSLSKIKGIQIEMSIEELYIGEMLFLDMINYLKNLGFNLYSLENGFHNPNSGKLLQVDGVFFNEDI